MRRLFHLALLGGLSSTAFQACLLSDAYAKTQSNSLIERVKVHGNERIERDTILSILEFRSGAMLSEADLDAALKRLYDMGYFSDVRLYHEGNTLVIEVKENPVVNQLVIEGNEKISDEILKSELTLRPRQTYTKTRARNDAQRIQDLYRLKGHYAAEVTPKIIRRNQNRVDVIFEVAEGEPTVVRKIFFVGNHHFKDSKLESSIQTKETRWYRFFTTDDNYDPDRLAYDQELLRKFYLEHGYADFQIKSAVAELSPDRKEFFITFTLDEGERYRVGKVSISSALPDVDAKTFEEFLTAHDGDWYSSLEVERTIAKVTDALGARGFAFVEIKPKLEKRKEGKTVDINLDIQEGPRVYVDKVIILGNDRTDEEILRRELRFSEGDPYNTTNVKLSERRLKGLGFFKKVDIRKEPSDAPDKVNIIIQVEEERTGEIQLGAGYSTTDGPIADIKFSERNFRGKGNDVSIGTRFGKRVQEYDFYYGEPWFLNRELQAGVRLFKTSRKKDYDESFNHDALGTTLQMGYPLSDNLNQTLHYTISREKISALDQNTSRYIREMQGKKTLSAVGQTLVYDERDNRHAPTEGYMVGLSNEFAGVGGDVNYFNSKLFAAWYYPVSDEVVFHVGGTVGNVLKTGKPLRVTDRITLGGDTLRGFDVGGISPRDKTTKEALGGTKYYTGTAELTFPVGLPSEFNVQGALFSDAGYVSDSGLPASDVIDSKKIRASGGMGLRWGSPMGPIRVDFAKAFMKAKEDKLRVVYIGFSTRF